MSYPPFDLYADSLEQGVHAIEASAGTGKTYTLTQLVVRLVVENQVPIDKILTVTFTRAAAAELRERVFERLSEVLQILEGRPAKDVSLDAWLNSLPDKEDIRRSILQARLMLDQAPIHTIDAFAIQVAREHALALGMPADAALLEDAERLDQQQVDSLWHEVSDLPPALSRAILSCWPSPDHLYERFKELGAQAVFDKTLVGWKTLRQQRKPIEEKWPAERLKAIYKDLDEHARKGCQSRSLNKCVRMILNPLSGGQLPRLEDKGLVEYLKASLKKDSAYEKLPESLRESLHALDTDLQRLPKEEAVAQGWFENAYERWQQKRQHQLRQLGLFTYDSLKHHLAEAVSQQPELCRQLRQQYEACLIDEFQDTDPDQWTLFSRVFGGSDQHRLFLIGDPKQAIYGFRGANLLTYFKAVGSAHHHHTLDTNYRSHPNVVEGFNQLFADQDETPTFMDEQCRYQTVKGGKSCDDIAFTLAGRPFENIRIVQARIIGDKDEDTLRQLARDVVWVLRDGQLGGARPHAVKPADIAILVKSNNDALAVQRSLRRVGVPSVLTSRTSVWSSDSATGLLQLMQAILNPRQAQTLRSVLISPFFQYSLKDLGDEAVYNAAQLQMSEALQRWEQKGLLAALLYVFEKSAAWVQLAKLPDGDRRIADTRHLLELLHQQAHQQNLSPQALLRWALQRHQGQAAEGHALRLEKDEDAVEIVTMHSAKGLEYPIVFVYGAWRGESVDSKSYPLGIPTPEGTRASFDKKDKEALKTQARQELRRLFYVACTRAISHLTIYWPDAGEVEKGKSFTDALNGILRPRLDVLRNSPVFVFEDYANESPPQWKEQASPPELVPPAEIDWTCIRERSRVLTSYSGLTRHSFSTDTPFARWQEEAVADQSASTESPQDALPASAAFGKLVHDFLERCNFSRPDWSRLKNRWKNFPRGGEENWADLKRLITHTLAADCRPFKLQSLRPEQIYREHHFVLKADSLDLVALNALFKDRPDWDYVNTADVHGYLQGYIDLITEVDGRYYIMDYKTNRLAAYDEAALMAAMAEHHYTLQALIYTLALDAHLRAFKTGYDPARHLGGVRYLFMRGMAPDSSEGVYAFSFDSKILGQARDALGGQKK